MAQLAALLVARRWQALATNSVRLLACQEKPVRTLDILTGGVAGRSGSVRVGDRNRFLKNTPPLKKRKITEDS